MKNIVLPCGSYGPPKTYFHMAFSRFTLNLQVASFAYTEEKNIFLWPIFLLHYLATCFRIFIVFRYICTYMCNICMDLDWCQEFKYGQCLHYIIMLPWEPTVDHVAIGRYTPVCVLFKYLKMTETIKIELTLFFLNITDFSLFIILFIAL